MHEHRGFRVPVGLSADVDAGHHDVYLAAVLGEFDYPLECPGHPVHVFGAGIHGDAGTGGERKPFDWNSLLLGQVQCADHQRAFRLGHCAERLGRIPEQGDTAYALGVLRRRGGDDTGDDAGLIQAAGPLDRDERAGVVEVVLHERAARASQHSRELVGVDGPPAPARKHLLAVIVHRLE